MFLHVFAHVERDQRVFVAEQEFRQGFGQLRLADAGRAQEDERAARTLRVFQAGAGAADALAHGLDGVFLADDALVELGLHVEEFRRLFFGQFVDRDSRPHAEHVGDCFFIHLVVEVDALRFDVGLFLGALLKQCALLVAEATSFFEALVFDGLLLCRLHFFDLVLDFFQVGRRLHALDAQTAARFVDEVDRFVRQVAVRDVAVGHVRCGDECLVGDGHSVVTLVLVADALQDFDGVRHRRFVDLHRLEPALERRIFLEVLAVLIKRGGADGLQLAACEHGLQD